MFLSAELENTLFTDKAGPLPSRMGAVFGYLSWNESLEWGIQTPHKSAICPQRSEIRKAGLHLWVSKQEAASQIPDSGSALKGVFPPAPAARLLISVVQEVSPRNQFTASFGSQGGVLRCSWKGSLRCGEGVLGQQSGGLVQIPVLLLASSSLQTCQQTSLPVKAARQTEAAVAPASQGGHALENLPHRFCFLSVVLESQAEGHQYS